MKRKVRIYKDPNGQGGYVNKTAQWLSRADNGMQTGITPVTAGIMGQMQTAPPQQMQSMQPQQNQEDMMLQEVTGMISKGIDKEEIKLALLAKLQIEQGTPEYADALVQLDSYLESVYDQLGEEARVDTNEKLGIPTDESEEVGETTYSAPNYYSDLAQEDNSNDDPNADLDAEGDDISFSRYGGTPNKSTFIKRTLKQLKKAEEGKETGEDKGFTANIRGTENNTSTSAGNINNFIAGIKKQVEENILKEDAEKMYNNMYGQGMPPQDGVIAQDSDYDQDDMDYAQFGGGAGRRMRRGMRKVFGRGATPPGVTSSKFTFGPLGGVRTADVQYNPLMMMSMYPGMTSGMGGFGYSGGYNSQQNRHSTGRLVTERVAKSINKDAIVEVADDTDSEAPQKAAETAVVAEDVVAPVDKVSDIVVDDKVSDVVVDDKVSNPKPVFGITPNSPPNIVNVQSELDKIIAAQSKIKLKRDSWGRPEGSKWYGFNPKTKKYEEFDGTKTPIKKAGNIKESLWGTDFNDPDNATIGDALNSEKYRVYAIGGSTNNLMPDPYGNLQQFVYGGDEAINNSMLQNLYQPPINEQDLNYTNSKDSTDPYFQDGGAKPFTAISSQEDYDKKLEEEKKNWQTSYDKTLADKQRQQQYDPRGYMSQQQYGSYGINQPVWGQPQYGGGRGLFGNLYSPYTRGPKQYSPVGDPLQYAATASMISKSGMLPTGVKYAKERKQDGNFFERKLGFNKDRTWTLDYATPEQIKSGTTNAQSFGPLANTSNQSRLDGEQNADVLKFQNQQKANNKIWDAGTQRWINGPIGNAFPAGDTRGDYMKSQLTDPDVTKFQASQQNQGKVWNESLKRWVDDPNNPISNSAWQSSPTPKNQAAEATKAGNLWYNEYKKRPDVGMYGNLYGSPLEKTLSDDFKNKYTGEELNKRLNFPVPQTSNQMPEGYSEMAYGGYIPSDYYTYGGYTPEAQDGLNMSPVAYNGNSIMQPGGIGQGQTGPCTEQEVLDINSPCYDPSYVKDPQTAQLKVKEQKSGTINYDNIARGYNAAATGIADAKDYYDERRTKYIPGMTNFAYGEKEKANEVVNRGEFDARTGREGISGFEGVIKRGGSIGHKKGGEYSLTMQEIHDLIRDGGLVEFLD
jgi:hypothetical protein